MLLNSVGGIEISEGYQGRWESKKSLNYIY